MNIGKRLLCLAVLSALVVSCKKDDKTANTPSTSTPPCFTVSGITERDDVGAALGVTDTTDWRLDEQWTSCVKTLFGGSNFNTGGTFDDSWSSDPIVFPNPTTDFIRMTSGILSIPPDTAALNHDAGIQVDLMITDQRGTPRMTYHTNKRDLRQTVFSLATLDSTATDTIFRVFYKFTDANNLTRMGHGDVVRR